MPSRQHLLLLGFNAIYLVITMLKTTPQNLIIFEDELANKTNDFQILNNNSPHSQSFTFIGHLQNKAIIWNTELSTLQSIAESHKLNHIQQFIHIQNEQDHYRLEIGLYLKQIDLAAIKRTIIMIRHYKNLRTGRHKYGPSYNFNH